MQLLLFILLCGQLSTAESTVTIAVTSAVAIKNQATVTLSCVITASTEPTKHGFKPDPSGSFKENLGAYSGGKITNTLVIEEPQSDETFTCFSDSTMSAALKTDVITIATESSTITAGEKGTIKCTATGYTTKASAVEVVYDGTTYNATKDTVTIKISTVGSTHIVEFSATGITKDESPECAYTYATNSVSTTAIIDFITLASLDLAVQEGTAPTIKCAASGVLNQPSDVWITFGGSTYKSTTPTAVAFTDQTSGKCEAEVVLSATSADGDAKCSFQFTSGAQDVTNKLDAVLMSMDTIYTKVGKAATFTCTVTKLLKDPSGGLTYKNGTNGTSWTKAETDNKVVFKDQAYANATKAAKLTISSPAYDSTYSCIMIYGASTISITEDLDVFTISSAGFSLTSGSTATLTCSISGVAIKPDSVGWGDIPLTHDVTKDSWASSTGTWRTTIEVQKVTADTTYTCTYVVDSQSFTKTALADVVVLTGVGKKVAKGSSGPACTLQGSQTKPTELTFTNKDGTFSAGTYTNEAQTISIAKTYTVDKTYTCKLTMATNSLTTTALVDVVVFDYKKVAYNKGDAQPSLTCETSEVTDISATVIRWKVGSTEYTKANTTQVTEIKNSILHLSKLSKLSFTADFAVTCYIDYSTNTLSEIHTNDFLELTSDAADAIVQKGNTTSVFCQLINAQDTYTLSWGTAVKDVSTKTTTVTGGRLSTLTYTNAQADATYTCSWTHGTYPANLKSFTKKPGVDVIETVATGDFVQAGSSATVTCKVLGAGSTATLNFEIGGKNYTSAKSETKDGLTIAHGAFASETLTSKVVGIFSTDTTVNCYATVGGSDFKMNSAVDTFVLTSNGFTTVKDDSAIIWSNIAGSLLIVKSHEIQWSTDLEIENTAKWYGWKADTESHNSTLSVSKVGADIVYTCTFTVNKKPWTENVPIDVIEKKVTVTSVRVGSATSLICAMAGSANKPTSVWFTTAGNSNKINTGTNKATGLEVVEVAYKANDGTMTSTLKITKAATDTVYTCFTEFTTNTLSWQLKSDTFTVTTASQVTVKGTTASVTCTVTGSDVAPSTWKWQIGSKTYSGNEGNYVLAAGAYANKAQSHVLTLAAQAADETVTCMVTVDSVQYTETIKIDIIEIEMIKTTVLTDASASITCKMSGYDSTTAPTDIWYDYSGSAYKASTTTTGNTVTKTAYNGGKQEAKLAVAKATADKTYTCHYKFPLNTITSTVSIDVYTIAINGIYEVPINNYAMFTCTVDRSQTKPSKMSWLIGATAVASPVENANYTVTEVAYNNQKMVSVLKIKKITVDSNIKCLTKIEFDGETPVTFVDVYSFSKQATIGFDNYNSTSVMLIKDIKKNIDKSRIKWGTTNSFASLSGDYSFTNTYNASAKQIEIRLAMKKGVGKTQSYYIKMDDIPAYVSDAPVDIGDISIDPVSINIIKGTSYNFTASITEFTADYTSNVNWSLNGKAFTPTSTVWNATSKTLTTTAHAVGATTTASILTFMIKNDYAQAVNTAPVHVAEMTVTEHTRITAGENLALTCTLTNILSDPTALVWWSNRGKNITGSAVTPAYTKAADSFISVLKVASYNHTDQVYTCHANVAKTVSQRKANVWQYVYFATSLAVPAKTASTILTCKVSGAKTKPSKWTWTPERTSILFKQSENAWNASEGSQESYITITNIAHDSGFSCEATISGYTDNAVTKTKLHLQADIYDLGVMGDMKVDGKAVKVVEKGKPAHFEIDFIDRTLPTNGTVTFGGKKYYTWKNESGYSFTHLPDKIDHGKKIQKMMFKIDAFDGTSGVMEVESSQETPPEVVPQKTLAHVIKKQLEIKFFTGTVTANAIITTGENAKMTCEVTGVNATETMAWVMVPAEKGHKYGKLNVTTTYANGKTSAVLETPKVLTNATTFHCNVGEFSYPANIWYFETKGTNATTIADTPTTLSCGTEGSKSAPVDIYWTDKAGTKYETKPSITGYKVTNTAFTTATGIQTSSLAITKPTSDQTLTCIVQVTSGFKTNKVLAVDVIAISGSDVELLKGGTAVVSVTVSGINSHSMKDLVTFTSKISGKVYHATKDGQVATSAVLNNTQVFNLTLANQLVDEEFIFSLKTPLASFNKTLKVDVIEMTLTHGQGYSGTGTTLTCAVSGVSGDPNFLWSVDGSVQSGSADTESAYSASTGVKSSTWKTGTVTKSVAYTCKVEIVSSGTTYIKETYYNVYALAMKDASIIDGNVRTLTCTITGASQATLNLIEWTNSAGNTKYTTFKNTYGKTESTSVLTTLSLYGDLVCKIDANKVQAKLDKILVSCTTGTAEVNTSSTITCTYTSIETDLTNSIAWNVTSGVTTAATWNANGKSITATLTIANLTADTNYLVTLTSQDGNKQTKVAMAKVLGASLSNPNPTQEAGGASFTISCYLKGASKAPTESYYLSGTTKITSSDSKVTASSFDVAKGSMSLLYVSTSTNTDITNLKCVFVVQPASKAVTLTVPFTVDAIDFTASTPVIMSKGTGSQNISCTYGETRSSLEQRSIIWEKGSAVVTGAKATGTKASTTSTLTVKDLGADTAYTCKLACNPTKILQTINVKIWSLTNTAEQYKALAASATVTCGIATSVLSKKATFAWKNSGSAISNGGVITITTDTNKQWSKVVISKVEQHYKLECTVVENGYTLKANSDIWVQHVETKVMSIPGLNNQYRFSCILTGFSSQPVPTYWTLNSTKYYPESGTSTVSVTTDNWGDKTGQLHLLQTETSSAKISADVTYTCHVVTSTGTLTKTATLDHITAAADSTQYIMKGLDLTLTTTFTGVNADYSSDVFWQKGDGSTKALYTKAVPNGQTVTTAYNSIAKTLTTVLKMKAYTLGDQTIFVTFNRTDTNLNAKTTFTVDQFEMAFNNAYFVSDGDVDVACSATGTSKAVKSITISSGSLKFTEKSKNATSKNGKLGSATADSTMKCVLDMDGTKLEKTAKLEKLSISIGKQTWSNGNAQFSATLDAISFDIESDVHWFVSGVAVKTGITNTYTTGIKIASVLTIKGTHASGNVSLTVGPSSSAATGTQSLDYYYLEMPAKVRVEKGDSVTVTCSVKAITSGLKSLELKTTAASSLYLTVTTDKYTVSLVLSKVAVNNILQCTATFADNVLNEMTQLTVYDIAMKVNGAAYTEGTKAWVTLNAKSSLECDMSTPTPATDAIQSLAWTKSLSTNTGTAVTTVSSNKTYALYSKTMSTDETFTCTFNFDGLAVLKKIMIITKGCQKNSVKDGSYTPTTTLPKIAPSTALTFKCTNSTKYQLTGNAHVKCTDIKDEKVGSDSMYYLKYNATWPTCKFVGDCADARTSFSSGSISPAYPFVNNKKYTFKCNTGYVLFGEDKVQCKGDSWTGARPKCEAIISECNDNDWGKAYGNKEGPYVAGDEITVFCSTGYTNAGASKLTCLKSGWDKVANCTAKAANQCSKIHPSSGEMECTKDGKTVSEYTEGVLCKIKCASGYKAVGKTEGTTCASNGTWSETTIPSCAQLKSPSVRKQKIDLSYGATYCVNADQVSKMSTAMTTVLKTGYKISCLVSGKCEVSDITCTPATSKFTVSFNLKQISDMSNTTVLTLSTAEITKQGNAGLTVTVAAQKKRSAIVKRASDQSYSSNGAVSGIQVSTCPNNTILENNLCTSCPAGYYKNIATCSPCAVAYYNEGVGATSCKACTSPKTTLYAASISATACSSLCTTPYVQHTNSSSVPQGSKVEDGAVVEYNCDEGYRHKDVAYYTCDPTMPEDQRTPVCENHNSNLILYLCLGVGGFFLIIIIIILIIFCCCGLKGKKKDKKEEPDYILENKAIYSNDEYKPRAAEARYGSRPSVAGSQAPSRYGAGGRPRPSNANSRI